MDKAVGHEGAEEEGSPVTPDFFQLMDKDGESCRQWAVILVANLAEFTKHLQFFPCLVQHKKMFILEEEECIVGKSLAENSVRNNPDYPYLFHIFIYFIH